jgi:hypothetical protein
MKDSDLLKSCQGQRALFGKGLGKPEKTELSDLPKLQNLRYFEVIEQRQGSDMAPVHGATLRGKA